MKVERSLTRGPSPTLVDQFTGLRANYDAARPSQYVRERSGWMPLGTGADYHVRFPLDYWRIIELARELDRNTLAGALLDRAATNIIQDGLRVDPGTGDAGLDEALRAYWNAWRHDPVACDVSQTRTFAHQQWLVCRHLLLDGDVFALLDPAGPVQLAEAHRVRKPTNTKLNCVQGILLDPARRPLEVWFTKDELDPWKTVSLVSDMQKERVRDQDGHLRVLHVRDERRISQTRGVSALASVFQKFSIHDDLQFAKLVQAIAVSCFTLVHQQGVKPAGGNAVDAPARGERDLQPLEDGRYRLVEGLTAGQEIWSDPGEKIEVLNANVPNETYLGFATAVLQEIAAQVNVPLIALLLDAKQTNFSGWRGAIQEAKKGWRRTQRLVRDRFVTPAYQNCVRAWAQRDAALRRALEGGRVDVYAARVHLPSWPYIQPEIEAEADALQIDKGLASPRRIMANRGGDYPEMCRERVEDFKLRIRAALDAAAELESETGLKIDPRQILNIDPDRPLLLEAPSSPAPSGAPVNAPLISDALARVARGELDADGGAALLAAAGVDATLAGRIVAGVKVNPRSADADTVEFQRKVFLAFQADGTVSDILANATALKTLTERVGLPVEESYQDPWIPVRDDSGQLVGGETIKDAAGDVIGAEPLEEEDSGVGVQGSAKPDTTSQDPVDGDGSPVDENEDNSAASPAEPRTAALSAGTEACPTLAGETPAPPHTPDFDPEGT